MAKHDFMIAPPWMNAAGSLGFHPDLHSSMDWSRLGTFVTNPISLTPRTPANGTRFATFPGGFLLHTGFPNPGLTSILRREAVKWQRSPVPVIVHLLASNPDEIAQCVRRLEGIEGVTGLELGVSSDVRPADLSMLIQAALGELPLIVRLPMERALELGAESIQAGADAISLAPPRGAIPLEDGILQGRLYGPAVYPLALRVVRELTAMSIATIGAGGIYTRVEAEAMLSAGALAVQLDSILWLNAGAYPSP